MKLTRILTQSSLAMMASTLMLQSAWAITPLDEEGMDNVSAKTGSYILNIYGAPSAGLSVDSEEDSPALGVTIDNELEERDSPKPEAENQLSLLDAKRREEQTTTDTTPQDINQEELEEAVEESEQFQRSAESFFTSSNIKYKPHGHHHDMTMMENGTIRVERDLQIEVLEFERFQGDELEDSTFGNLYLSDWTSRGSSHIQLDNP